MASMASAFQSGFASASLQVVLEKLADFALKQVGLILGVDDEFRRLQRTLQKVGAIIDHVENNQVCLLDGSSHEVWKMWIVDLEEISFCAEDLVDEILLDFARANADYSNDGNQSHQVRNKVLSSLKFNLPSEINKMWQELDVLASEMDSLFLTKLSELGSNKIQTTGPISYNCFSTSSLVDERFIVRRADDRDEVINMLLNPDDNDRNVSVIPLVGMGGIGKTTLAQTVYNDDRVLESFQLRIWISVSVKFDLIKITQSMIESITGERCKLSNLDTLQSRLRHLLSGQRFLLVLDDFWTEKYGDWEALSSPFSLAFGGSKVIVTTRSAVVSLIVGTLPAYNLKLLSDEDCWELMRLRAFSNINLEEYENFEHIGRRIAMKCKGLPIAAKSLGGLLRFRSSVEEWVSILQSELWNLAESQDDTFSALFLSYYCLPGHLRKCFAYCSMFPRNHDFEMSELVLLWMAEGFIRHKGEARLEEIGCGYFKELMWRSFFQFSRYNLLNQPLYKVHDLIHSMAQLVSGSTCFCLEGEVSNWHAAFKSVRHLSLGHENMHLIGLKASTSSKRLRTLLVMPGNGLGIIRVSYELFLKLKRLRVLNLSQLGIDELPDSIDNLKHLRFLDLSENTIQSLPESITNLLGLQTLMLKECPDFLELPKNFKNLAALRHLHLDVKSQLNYMPSGFGNLVNLQTLYAFVVGREKGCGIGELGYMRSLRGSICITNLENVTNMAEAEEANLSKKHFLDKLELEWSSIGDGNNQQEILARLKPHENLKQLRIENYSGLMFPGWLSDRQSKLTSIHLQNCQYCFILPSLGQLPLLKCLHIEHMSGLEQVDNHFYGLDGSAGFPLLESLTFQDMPSLTEWIGFNRNHLPRLQDLTVINCPMLASLPSLHNLNLLSQLSISRCSNLQALPEQGLPGSLQTLIILECAILRERCQDEEGEDWHQIREIPTVEIDDVRISFGVRRV